MKINELKINQTKVRHITITEGNELQRLDNFLLSQYKGVPKSLIYRIIRKGNVRINKGRAKPSDKLHIGDVVRIPPIEVDKGKSITNLAPKVDKNLKDKLLNSIIYEDDGFMILNKPSGLAVHGGSGINLGLIEILRSILPHPEGVELVHRLDRDTSGCILIAKKRSSLRALHALIRENKINKIYHTLVLGKPNEIFKATEPLKKNQLQSGERIVRVDLINGAESLTKFKKLRQFASCALIEARPITGRTHQIRVHSTIKGYPIAGDIKYGDKDFNVFTKSLGLKRLFLHAKNLEFIHPKTNELISITAEYDHNLNLVLQRLEEDLSND